MDLYEVADQIVKLLQQRGRLTYRVLKRQFALEDDILEDLKEEILYAQPHVIDDEGKGLIWTGETDAAPVETPPAEPRTPDAERRQLTVMFCDLVGSTHLSGQLDPEDLRDVIRAYQAACTDVIQRFDGYVAQHLGDGLLIYFGYPTAHEDDAQRAIRTGLGIIEAMQTLNQRLAQSHGFEFEVRIGIHTGLVVIGDIGAGERHEQLALGETPNVAARIQGLAEPDTVVMSDATHRLVDGYFACRTLGRQALKGVDDPVSIYCVLSESDVQGRLDIARARGLTPLVGREQEVGLLLEHWGQAKKGQGQVALLSGEAGIGKSRLVQVLKDQIADEPHSQEDCRCSPYHTNSAFFPLVELLQHKLGWRPDDHTDEKLRELETILAQTPLNIEIAAPLFARLLSLPLPEGRYPPMPLTSQQQRQQILDVFLRLVLQAAESHPVLFIVEDLHWIDPSTLEFLELLMDQAPTMAILILLTCRPEFQPTWSHRSDMTEISLNRLSRPQTEQIAMHVAKNQVLPGEVMAQLVDKTDGVPLYVEEMTKTILESGALQKAHGQSDWPSPMSALTIPATLQDSLMARLDRLMTAKVVAQLGATIGRQFSYKLLQAVAQLDETTLQRELERLVEAELVYQQGLPPHATYRFKHALIQDVAYESLLHRTRQGYHQRIAAVLAERFPEAAETRPEWVAHHCAEAGMHEQAVTYWHQAGEQALQRSAHQEGIHHLTKGLGLIKTFPDTTQRAQQELALLTALGPALMATKGYTVPDVKRIYERSRKLCQRLGDSSRLFQVLRGLGLFYFVRAELQSARELGEQLLTLARHQHDPMLVRIAHVMLGQTLLYLGEFALARTHLEQDQSFASEHQQRLAIRYGVATGVQSLLYAAQTLWLLGYPDQALWKGKEALALVRQLSHPHSLALAQYQMALLYMFRREIENAQSLIETTILVSVEQHFPLWKAAATCVQGLILVFQGQTNAGLSQLREGLMSVRSQDADVFQWVSLGRLAEAYAHVNQFDEGLRLLNETLIVVDERWLRLYEAELHRLKGQLLLAQSSDNTTEAEICFNNAIRIAQNQSAKSWELRAAASLARLWQSQGKRQEAYDLLAPVYNWFTEGFDTADLQDAKALLDAW